MSEEPAEIVGYRTFLDVPSSALGEVVRYGVSMTVVAALAASVVIAIGHRAPEQDAAEETDSAVMVDLPPAEASSRPASEAADGPEQQAAQAAPAQQAPETVEPPKPIEPPKPVADPPPAAAEKPVEPPPPDVRPDPPAVLEREVPPVTPPPKPVVAPATLAQDEHAPAGTEVPAKTDADTGDAGRPPPTAHAITLWQKSLMKRLEAAKREVAHEPHAAGTVKVAFEIDAGGALASERVAQSSGSASLDKAALLLVRRAAPFPAPPAHAASGDTSFVVPVRFR